MKECVALESNKMNKELPTTSHTPWTRSLNLEASTPLIVKILPATLSFLALGTLLTGAVLTKA